MLYVFAVADSHLNSNVGKLDFEDANFADSPRSEECTLILAQGGYAAHFAVSCLACSMTYLDSCIHINNI